MTHKFFILNSASDLYRKCLFEFSLISDEANDDHIIYQLFNIILSLNHLVEWYLKDKTIVDNSKKIHCLQKFYSYEKQGNETEVIKKFIKKQNLLDCKFQCNKNQKLIRLISNQIKHVEVKITTNVNSQFIIQCGEDITCGDGSQAGEYKYVYCVNDGNEEIDVLILINDLLLEWSTFIELID